MNGIQGPAHGLLAHVLSDSMVNGSAAAMRCRPDFSGAGRVMCGTDFPVGPDNGEYWPVEVLDTIRSPGLGETGLAAVPGGDLHRIMRLSPAGS